MKKRIFAVLTTAAAMALALLLTACGAADPSNGTSPPSGNGTLTLRADPEIRIEYNAEGLVTALEGRNDNGKALVAKYTGYIGKNCSTVLKELVGQIHEAGYFIEDADGLGRNIVLQLEPGSALPDDDFLELLSRDVQSAVQELAPQSQVVEIGSDDYDKRYDQAGTPSPYITMDKAKEIVLAHAGIAASDAKWDDREFDFDSGYHIFELEFTAGDLEYEYDVDATNGKILAFSSDRHDIWDD